MTGTQALAERVVRAMIARDEFSRWLGIEVIEIAPQRSTVRMTVRQEMVNGFGVSHGGIVYSLADSALAFAANTNGNVTVAIENSISYPQPVNVNDQLTAVAEEESFTNRLGYYRVSVRNQNDLLVAIFRGTVYRTKRAHG
ncbi:MAG TPA: hydroxyphenylacetyl-CoA thioesterase PaaI [Gemmatimonadaceae bacterium]|nr:hydroxyphenylacetyl-CoA thioesterase PaaI [Gemmatimonadaceae bacterium]